MSLSLSLYQAAPGRISLFGITPDRLLGKSLAEIEKLPLAWGNEAPALGEFFKIGGSVDAHLVFDGMDRRFSDVGGGMASGTCTVIGDAGDFVGRDMRGGRLLVEGAVGQFAAAGLAGGALHIHGDAGDRLGAALPWLPGGMRGGRVVVDGNVGERCGDKLRRGEIFVGGNAGAFCATRMVAGSIIVAGELGPHAAYGMRRGTLLLLNQAFLPPPTFCETGMVADTYLRLVWRDWLSHFDAASPFAEFAQKGKEGSLRARRWMGDVSSDGRGEVFGFGG